ncbi:unnamed protein product [Adineta ricciae]|uniref:TIR domain-containing protein n=1 Tax=Adineta ricciae TaxID=249248 RepID=A0A815X8M1_ADIRI|nr:unnamed protein product [Adineta ricciae]CAF1554391.1 unnamed protein product [Adineta ricciae]
MNNLQGILEPSTDLPALREMVDELHGFAPEDKCTSNTNSSKDSIQVDNAILYGTSPEARESCRGTGDIDSPRTSNEGGIENLLESVNSTAKCLSCELSDPAPPELSPSQTQPAELSITVNTSEPQTVTAQSTVASPAVSQPVTTNQLRKPHIMISYNRSCQKTCEEIRKHLRGLKYIVWMDVYDMRNNFIQGMAQAIADSYIVLMCLNHKYDQSFWCQKEAERISIKQIKFIPCIMEDNYIPSDWLSLLLGGNIKIDFSDSNKFNESFQNLRQQITYIEEELATSPRQTPPPTPTVQIAPNTTVQTFDNILRSFKTWVEDNRDALKRCDQNESIRLINELIQGLDNGQNTTDSENKRELLRKVLSTTSQNQSNLLSQLINSINNSCWLAISVTLTIMALWAAKIIFDKN